MIDLKNEGLEVVTRNFKTREGYDVWDKLCSIPKYGFLIGPSGGVAKVLGIGNWIDRDEAQSVVDVAQTELNEARAEALAGYAVRDARIAEQDVQIKVLQSDANSWQSGYDEGRRMGGKHCMGTIDQQAQRIAELEGLLLDSAELIKHGVFEDGICCCGASVDSHGFGDGHSPVDALAYHAGQVCERIDAALSAGKEGE